MLLLFFILWISKNTAATATWTSANCTPSNGCRMQINEEEGMECYGLESCKKAKVKCTTECKILCSGESSCEDLEGVCADGSNNCNIEIICEGYLSCLGFSKSPTESPVNSTCRGMCSCLHNTLCLGPSDQCILHTQNRFFDKRLCRFSAAMVSLTRPDNVQYFLPPATQILLKSNTPINQPFISALDRLVSDYSAPAGGQPVFFDESRITYNRAILFIMTNRTNIKSYVESVLKSLLRDILFLSAPNVSIIVNYTLPADISQPQTINYFIPQLTFQPGLWSLTSQLVEVFPLQPLSWNETVTDRGVEGYITPPSNCSLPRPFFQPICVNGLWMINDTVVDRVDMIATRTEVFVRKMEVQSEIMVFSKLNVEGLTLLDSSKLVIDGGLGVQLVVSGTLILGGSLVVRNVTFDDLAKGIEFAKLVGSAGNIPPSENIHIYINDSSVPNEHLSLIEIDSTLMVIYKTNTNTKQQLHLSVIILLSIIPSIMLLYIFSFTFRKFVAPFHNRQFKVFEKQEHV